MELELSSRFKGLFLVNQTNIIIKFSFSVALLCYRIFDCDIRRWFRKIFSPIFGNGEYQRRMNRKLYELYGESEVVICVKRLRWVGPADADESGALEEVFFKLPTQTYVKPSKLHYINNIMTGVFYCMGSKSLINCSSTQGKIIGQTKLRSWNELYDNNNKFW